MLRPRTLLNARGCTARGGLARRRPAAGFRGSDLPSIGERGTQSDPTFRGTRR